MTTNDLKQSTTKKLETELLEFKVVTGGLFLALIALVAVTIYGYMFKDSEASFVELFTISFGCGIILFLQIKAIKKIRTELKSRTS